MTIPDAALKGASRLRIGLVADTHIPEARKELWAQEFSRGLPTTKLLHLGSTPNRRGTSVTFVPDAEIFGDDARFKPARLFKLVRSKAYLFAGVEIRWKCAPSLTSEDVPAEAVFQFPGGLADHLKGDAEPTPRATLTAAS